MTADSDSSAAAVFEETPIGQEADPKGIEATLHQIATGLQSVAEGYLALASHMSQVAPYELPQMVAQIPPPPMDVPLSIRKALLIDGQSKAVSYLIHGEYELTNISWSKLHRKNTTLVGTRFTLPEKEKEDLEVLNTNEKENKEANKT